MRTPTRTICPGVIVIDDDVSDGHSAQSAVDFKHFTNLSPSLEDDDSCTDLEGGPFTAYCTTPRGTIHALTPTEVEDGSDLDVVFKQYVRSRSLSPSPSPDDTPGELSGATLIGTERDQGTGGAELSREAFRVGCQSPVPENVSETQEAGHQEGIGYLGGGPRIRLRFNRPKITLRLKLPITRQAGLGAKKRAKRRIERLGAQREKGKKGAKSKKAKKAKNARR